MATPVIESVQDTATTGAGTSVTVALPSGITSGDGILVIFASDKNPTVTFPAGYTEILDYQESNQVSLAAAYRKSDGTEGANITVTQSTAYSSAARVYRISGTDFATYAPEVSTPVSGNSSTCDPGAVTHSKGADDYLYLALCSMDTLTPSINTYPTGYLSTGTLASGASGSQCQLGYGAKGTTGSSTEDPSAFIWSAANDYVAATVAVPTDSAVSSGVTGTINETLENASSNANGTVTVSGSLSETLENASMSASGNVGANVSGSISVTLEDCGATASGLLTASGSISETLDDVTSVASGLLTVIGSLSEALEPSSSAASGSIVVSGSISKLLEDATITASGVVGNVVAGTINAVLENVSGSAAGVVPYTGTIDQTLEDAQMTASGSVVLNVTGSISETLAPATMIASGAITVNVTGSLASVLQDVSASGSGSVVIDYITPKHNMTLTVENRIMTLTIENRIMRVN